MLFKQRPPLVEFCIWVLNKNNFQSLNINVDSGCTSVAFWHHLQQKWQILVKKRESVAKLHHFTKRWTAQPRVNFDGGWKSRLWVKFAHFQDKADISESTTGAFPAHNTKDFQGHQHQQHQHQQGSQVQQGGGNISSSASPSMKQPGQQEGGGGPTGQHANVIIPRGGRRPSGKQVRRFFLGGGEKILVRLFSFPGSGRPASQCWLWHWVSAFYSWSPGCFYFLFIPSAT